jgi:hypothetical protein
MFEPKIELKAVVELDAPTYMNMKRFIDKMLHEHGTDHDREALGKLIGVLNDYDLEGY